MRDVRRPDPAKAEMSRHAGIRAARNTVVLIVLRLGVPLLSLALVFTLSRLLGAEGLGRYTLVFSFLALLAGLGPLGLPTVITREGTSDRAALEAMLRNAMTLGAFASALLTLVMMASGSLLKYDEETRTSLAILSLAIFPYTVGMFLDAAIVALERMHYMAVATLSEYSLKVGVGVLLLLFGFGLDAVLITAVAGRVLGCLISARLLRGSGLRVGWALDTQIIRKLTRLAPTFLLTAVFATLYWRIDILMLSKLAPVEDLGYYGAAYRLFELTAVFPQSLCLSLYPQIAAASQTDKGHLVSLGRSALRYLMVVSLPAAVFMTLLAQPLLELLYGTPFDPAAKTLGVLAWTLIPYGLVRYHAYVLVAANQQRVDLLLNVVMCFVNVALNLVLIPRYSHFGAACATLASICMLALLQYEYLRRFLPGHAAGLSLPPAVPFATLVAGLCAWLLRDVNILIPIALVPIIYLMGLFLGRFFSSAELKFLRLHGLLGRFGLAERVQR